MTAVLADRFRKATRRSDAPTRGPAPAGARTGIEIDGGHVRVAVIDPAGVLVAFNEYTGATTGEALTAWKNTGRAQGRVVVSWAGGALLRDASIPPCDDSVLERVLRDASDGALPIGGWVVAGDLIPPPSNLPPAPGELRPVIIVASPIVELTEVHQILGANISIVPSVLCGDVNGMHVIVRSASVEMRLVHENRLVIARRLEIDGVDRLAEDLDAQPEKRTEIIDRYRTAIRELVLETTRQWLRDPRTIVQELYLSGVGANLPGLVDALVEATAMRVLPPPVPEGVTATVDNWPIIAGAVSAALADVDHRPQLRFVDVIGAREAASVEARSKKRTRRIMVATAVAGAAVVAATPLVLAWRTESSARDSYLSAKRSYQSVASAEQLKAEVDALSSFADSSDRTEVAWSQMFSLIGTTLPARVTPTNVEIRVVGTKLEIRGDIAGVADSKELGVAALTDWLTRLNAAGIPGAWVGDITTSDGTVVQGQLLITIDSNPKVFFHLQPPGGPTAAQPTATSTAAKQGNR
jgi:hypothetical protein